MGYLPISKPLWAICSSLPMRTNKALEADRSSKIPEVWLKILESSQLAHSGLRRCKLQYSLASLPETESIRHSLTCSMTNHQYLHRIRSLALLLHQIWAIQEAKAIWVLQDFRQLLWFNLLILSENKILLLLPWHLSSSKCLRMAYLKYRTSSSSRACHLHCPHSLRTRSSLSKLASLACQTHSSILNNNIPLWTNPFSNSYTADRAPTSVNQLYSSSSSSSNNNNNRTSIKLEECRQDNKTTNLIIDYKQITNNF